MVATTQMVPTPTCHVRKDATERPLCHTLALLHTGGSR